MAVYLGRAEHGGSPNDFKRVVLEWEGGELVVAPGKGGALEVEIKVGHEHEKHELEFHASHFTKINNQSKLIQIEDTGASLPEAQRAVVRQQSKLIKIEETKGRQLAFPTATILVP